MKHTIVRITLFVLELLAALRALVGGLALLAGVIRFPLEQLQGTPFRDYTFPGLILAIVIRGSSLIGAATAFLHRELAVLFSAVAGLILAGWITCEIILLGPFALVWQILFWCGVWRSSNRTGLLSLDDRVSRPALPISTCQPRLKEHGKQAILHAFASIETVTFLCR